MKNFKSLLFVTVITLSLFGCGMPLVKSSWDNMGTAHIAKLIADTHPSSLDTLKNISWESKLRKSMINYCKFNNLYTDLKSCLIKMGMSCQDNFCSYEGNYWTLTGRLLMVEDREKFTHFIKINIDTEKGWDSFIFEFNTEKKSIKSFNWSQ